MFSCIGVFFSVKISDHLLPTSVNIIPIHSAGKPNPRESQVKSFRDDESTGLYSRAQPY